MASEQLPCFGHFVGDVEAKSGYGDFKLGPFGGSSARIEATIWAQIGAVSGSCSSASWGKVGGA